MFDMFKEQSGRRKMRKGLSSRKVIKVMAVSYSVLQAWEGGHSLF